VEKVKRIQWRISKLSVIKVDNIRIASESVSRPVTGVAAAFLALDYPSGVPTAGESFNIDSLVDTGAGLTNVTYTSDMANNNYAILIGANDSDYGNRACYVQNNTTANGTRLIFVQGATDNTEDNTMNMACLGDLA